ncbi:MAG TPA: beta-propeller fold lactonase family protein [Verrucomicrobiae bacterium]|nr:beta-propeller fold lactonase family protein [Verrucomicrobiae bacterium]
MNGNTSVTLLRGVMAILFAAISLSLISSRSSAQTRGFVYVATNQPSGNSVIQFARAANGTLAKLHETSTGGLGGTGNGVGALDPLGSQDSLVLNGTGSLLLVVNAGSDQLSAMSASSTGLQLKSIVSSGGSFPNSVALSGDLVYVLNAHGTPNISGFRVSADGILTAIPNSTTALPGGSIAKPHDVRFSPDGTHLIVSDEGNNQLDVFELGSDGLVTNVNTQPSAGSAPFGMRFARTGVLVNTEANSGSVSSYALSDDTLMVISPAVGDGQAATCWVTVTRDGKFAFISNTGSGNLSTYQVGGNGRLNLAIDIAASIGKGAPIDTSLTSDGAFLYVDDSALGRVVIFRVHGASLHAVGSVNGLPTTLQGIAAQ